MPEASPLHFRKMNGLGNDFVVFDARKRSLAMDEAKARAIAARSWVSRVWAMRSMESGGRGSGSTLPDHPSRRLRPPPV